MVLVYVCQEMEGNAQRLPAGWRDVFELRVSRRWHKTPCLMAVALTAFGSGKVRRGMAGIPRSELAQSAGCTSPSTEMASLVSFATLFFALLTSRPIWDERTAGEKAFGPFNTISRQDTALVFDSSPTTPPSFSSRFPAQPSHSR